MTFLAPFFLWFVPLAALPVIFHLFFKVKKRPLPFSSLMFFLRVEPNLQARRKLREILLLALRVLLILCVVLALARPLLPAIGNGGQVALVLVLDNSGSMAANGEGGRPRLKIAAECAAALVGELRPGDLAGVVLAVDDRAVAVGAGLLSDRAALRAVIDQLTSTEASADPAEALHRALALAAEAPAAAREIHIFSDLQEGEWARPAGDVQALPAGTRVVVHRIAAAGQEGTDVAVRAVRAPASRIIAGRPARSEIALVNPSANEASVRLRVSDDSGEDSVRPVTVPAHGEMVVPVVLTPVDPGFHWAMARIEGDTFAADDRAGLGLWCGARGGVLFAGRREDFALLPIALAPDGSGEISGLVPTWVPSGEIEAALRERKPLLAVMTWADLDALTLRAHPALTTLRQFVAAGGSLLVLPDPGGLGATSSVPDWVGATPGKDEKLPKPSAALVLDPSANCWNDLRDAAGAVNLQGAQISRCIALKPTGGARPLLGLADGRAVLIENALGSGRVYACGLAFHPAWSTLPLKAWSLALVQGLALPPPGEANRVLRLTAGQGLPRAPGDVTATRIRSLAGGPLDWQGRREQAPPFARAGVYAIEGGADGPRFAVVCASAGEGVARFVAGGRVPVLGSLPHRVLAAADARAVVEDWRGSRRGSDLFSWLVVLAVLAWIAEGLIATAPGPAATTSGSANPGNKTALPQREEAHAAAASTPTGSSLGIALLWTPHLPPLLLAAVALAVATALVVFHRRLRRRLSPGRTALVLWPKAALAALLLMALFDPALRHERREPAHGTLAVLIDTSSSMEVVDDGHASRLERARRLAALIAKRAPTGVTVKSMAFDTRLRDTLPDALPAGERPGDPGVVLQSVASDPRLTGCIGVVALTDGGDEPFSIATPPPVPLSIIGIGALGADNEKRWNDLAVAEVRAPGSAEVHLDFTIDAELQAHAADAAFAAHLAQVPVALELESDTAGKREWKEVARATVDLSNQRAAVSFKQNADTPGLRRYRIAVPAISGEVSVGNNTQTAAVEVREQSLHVLYFTRELGAEFKALRQELARDPGVTFTALFRTLSVAAGDRYTLQGDRLEGDVGLEKGFPSSAQALTRYGCVVVGSFPSSGWKSEEMAALVEYINQGGAAVFLGGEQAFAGGGYANTVLAPLIPWNLSAAEGAVNLRRGGFAVTVPMAAAAHPAVAGLQPLFAAAPGTAASVVDSVNPVGALKPGAMALLECVVDGRTQPLLALQTYGKGKVAAVATNTLWRLAHAGPENASAYGRLWRQLVRHLADAGDQSHLVRVQWDKEHYRPGDEANAILTVLSAQAGAAAPRLVATLATGGAEPRPVALESAQGQTGSVRAGLHFAERGDYRFRVVVYQDERVADTYEKIIAIAPHLGEGNRLRVDEPMLRAAASAAGGTYASEADSEQVLGKLQATLAGKPLLGESSLVGGNAWYLALVVGLLLVEWLTRRRMHLL